MRPRLPHGEHHQPGADGAEQQHQREFPAHHGHLRSLDLSGRRGFWSPGFSGRPIFAGD
jgi:hypothetical protein